MLVSTRSGSTTLGRGLGAPPAATRPGPGVVVGQPVDVVVQRVQPAGGQDADLAHAAAVALAPDPRARPSASRAADEHRADRGAETLAQADRDGVELPAPYAASAMPVATWAFQSRAPSRCMATPALARRRAQLADRVERLDRAAAEVVGVLDDDQRGSTPGRRPASGCISASGCGGVEQPARRRPGAGGDAGEHRRGAHLGPQDVREAVGDELLAGRDVQPHPELVGQRARRREQPGLVAEQARRRARSSSATVGSSP